MAKYNCYNGCECNTLGRESGMTRVFFIFTRLNRFIDIKYCYDIARKIRCGSMSNVKVLKIFFGNNRIKVYNTLQ